MFKRFLFQFCLFALLFIGIDMSVSAQSSRQILVVSPYAQATYKVEDQNKLQSAIHSFRKKYGLVVQGYDNAASGYLIFSSQTTLSQIPAKELEALKSEIKEVYPQSVFTLKQQNAPVHQPKDSKQPSAKSKSSK